MSGIDLTLDNIKNQLNDLRQEFTLTRKKGIDVAIASLKFMGIPPKIAVVQATQSYEDLKKLVAEIEEVRRELKEAQGEVEAKQISAPTPPTAPIPVPSSDQAEQWDNTHSRLHALLVEIDRSEASNDRTRMSQAYAEIRGLYPSAPEDMKKEMYKKTLELYERLKKK
jgi:multidrug resistance efflux pump